MTYKVYTIKNIKTGQRYIGVTSQKTPKRRIGKGKNYSKNSKIRKAIDIFGWDNFIVETLFETNDREEASLNEAYYIKLYNSIDNGYNTQTGGFANYTFVGRKQKEYKFTKEHRTRISTANKGKHMSNKTEFKKGVLYNNKKVQCKETGIIYKSIAEAAKLITLGHHIGECCTGKRKTCAGYHWVFVEEGDNNGSNSTT